MTSGQITAVGFAAIGVAVLVVELLARRPGSRVPTFSELVGFVMRERWGRWAMLGLWWWLGWHFLSRS